MTKQELYNKIPERLTIELLQGEIVRGIETTTITFTNQILKKDTLRGKSDFKLTKAYKAWVSDTDLINERIRKESGYFQTMDDLLFAVGKYLKSKKRLPESTFRPRES